MFGRRFFGGGYWGAAYWGEGEDPTTVPQVSVRRFRARAPQTRFGARR